MKEEDNALHHDSRTKRGVNHLKDVESHNWGSRILCYYW